jgi:protease I
LTNKKVAFLVAPEGVEQAEFTEPWDAIRNAGGTTELVSTEIGRSTTVANPDLLRTDAAAVAFARSFFDAGPANHVLAEPADRSAQRRRRVG